MIDVIIIIPRVITGQGGELFTSVLYNLYVAPEGFCFDAFCNDDPILDNPKLHGYNVNVKVIIIKHNIGVKTMSLHTYMI